MFTIAGATGHVGSAVAEELLARGTDVTTLVRDEAKGAAWSRRGARPAVADLTDRAGLADALRGAEGFFAMLPFDFGVEDFWSHQDALVAAIAGAVEDSAVPHVVVLSSAGADLAEGTGPIRGLHRLENRLRETGTVVSAIRARHFQEKVEDILDAAVNAGIYVNLGESADVPIPMVATRDVGAVAARALVDPPPAHQVIDVDGPEYTERQVADRLADALGRPLEVVNVPRPGWVGTLQEAGLPAEAAELIAELYDADQRGILRPVGDHHVRGRTGIDETLRHIVGGVPATAQ